MVRRALPLLVSAAAVLLALGSVRVSSDALFQVKWAKKEIRVKKVVANANSYIYEGRLRFLLESLPEILKHPDTTTLFFGSSLWQFFLDPKTFDAYLGEPQTSYNLSFPGLMSTPLYVFVSRFRTELMGKTEKLDAVVFEFSPLGYSFQFDYFRGFELDYIFPSSFFSPVMWRDLFIVDPRGAAELWFGQTVRPYDWLQLPRARALLRNNEPRRFMSPKPGPVPLLWRDRRFYEVPEWRLAQRGLFDWNLPATQAEFDQKVAEIHSQWDSSVNAYAIRHGVDGQFRFDEKGITLLVRSVELAKTFARHVYVVQPPYSPALQHLCDRYVDAEGIRGEIAQRTGVPVLDLSHAIPLTDADFVDPMHARKHVVSQYLEALAGRIRTTPPPLGDPPGATP